MEAGLGWSTVLRPGAQHVLFFSLLPASESLLRSMCDSVIEQSFFLALNVFCFHVIFPVDYRMSALLGSEGMTLILAPSSIIQVTLGKSL